MAFNSIIRAILTSTFMVSSSQSQILSDLANRYLDGTLPADFFKNQVSEFKITQQNLTFSSKSESTNYVNNEDYDAVPALTQEGVLIFPIIGTIMKHDGYCGTVGTSTMRTWLQKASTDPQVKSILFYVDSGGGQVSGTWEFANEIANFSKPKYAWVDGYCCSGAYYAICSCQKIYSSSPDNLVGSIGVAYLYRNRTAQLVAQGVTEKYVYATTSDLKHGDSKALEQNDPSVLQNNQLDPTDETFMTFVKTNRPQVSEEALKGLEVVSSKAMSENTGLIDGIQGFDLVYTSLKKEKNMATKVKLSIEEGLVSSIVEKFPTVTRISAEDEAEELKTAKSTITALEATKVELTTQAEAATQKIAGLETKTSELNATIESLNSTVVEKDSKIAEKDTEITALKGKLSAFTNPITPPPAAGAVNPVVPTNGEPINTKVPFVKKELNTKGIDFVS